MILALFLYHQRILAFSALCDDQVVRNNGKQNETKKLEVISKPQIRSKGKASGRSGKRSPPEADEHLPEACNPPRILADHWA
jgi:hypothetical protein